MPKFAQFDGAVGGTQPVSGWYDTDRWQYANLPSDNNLFLLTEEEWDGRLAGLWAVQDGTALVPYTPPVPPPTPAQVLASKIADGIAITSTGNPSMDGVWALDSVTLDQIGSVARDFASGLGLPGGNPVFAYPNAAGVPVVMSGDDVKALYSAQRDLLFLLNMQMAILAHGGSPTWPAQTATLP